MDEAGGSTPPEGDPIQAPTALAARMEPRLHPEAFVFGTCAAADAGAALRHAHAWLVEDEGVSLLLPEAKLAEVRAEFPHGGSWRVHPGRFRMITLTVHSSLDAVGFLSAIAAELSRARISTNVLAGFYHDHLLVPEDRAVEAMRVLRQMQARAAKVLRERG